MIENNKENNDERNSNSTNGAVTKELLEGGISVQRLVCPKTNRTSHLHVEILTIPPNRRMTGTSAGVESYLILKGTLHINDDIVITAASSNHTTTIEPFCERTLLNLSSTMSTTVWRATDGAPTKDDTVVDTSTVTRLKQYFQSSSREMKDYVTMSLPSFSSSSAKEEEKI